jgi:predicted amino acid dehydrogenase
MTAHQMMERRELAKTRVVQAAAKAEKLGVGIVGLGALTSSVTGGGELIRDQVKVKITSGHAYTAYIVTSYVFRAIDDFCFDRKNVKVAVVGAAGSIGSTCARILVQRGIDNILLVDMERKLVRLEKLLGKLHGSAPGLNVELSHRIGDIRQSDIVIAATNAPEALIKPDDLKPGAIIVDDAQPSDISPEVAKQRDDVLVVDAGVLSVPGINLHFNMGLAEKHNVFSCLGEILIMAATDRIYDYKIGEVGLDMIEEIGRAGESLGFRIDNYQRFGHIYSEVQLDRIRRVIERHR